jgi:hypothetical protein
MGIIQSLTKQDVVSFHRTLLNAVKSSTADKAMPSTEEQVCVIQQKMRKGIKHKAIYGDMGRSGKDRTFIKHNPVGVMEVGHGLLSYQNPLHRSLPLYL